MSTHHPSFGRSSGLGNVFKSISKSLKSTSNKNVAILINPTIIGGGSDQQKLLSQLQNGPLPRRASAASKVTESLRTYAISSIPEIWYLARDMCDSRIQSYIRRSALELLIECIKQDDMASISIRLMYFKDIASFCQLSENKIDPDLDLFLKSLRVLTNDGRDIHDFCVYDKEKNLNHFIEQCLFVLGKSAKYYTDRDDEETLSDNSAFQNLLEIIRLTKNCLKFSFGYIDEAAVTSIIFQIISIASRTSNPQIIIECLELLQSVAVFGSIPSKCYRDIIEFLSSIYGLNDDYTKLSWDLINNLCMEQNLQIVISNLCDIALNNEVQHYKSMESINYSNILSSVRSNVTINSLNSTKDLSRSLVACLGSIQLLERIIVISCLENRSMIDGSFVLMFKTAQKAISYNIPIINTAYLRSFDRLFSSQLGEEFETRILFDKLLPFQLWYSNTFSLYDVLSCFKLNSEQDLSYLKSICSSLQDLYESHELHSPKDKLVNFFLSHHQHLSASNIKFVLTYYSEEKMCSLLNPLWKENCVKLLDYFYYPLIDKTGSTSTKFSSENMDSEQILDIRLETLRVVKEGHDISMSVFDESIVNYEIIFDIFKKSIIEQDERITRYLADNFLTDIALRSLLSFFNELSKVFMPGFQVKCNLERRRSLVSMSSLGSTSQASGAYEKYSNFSSSFLQTVTESIIRVFLISSTEDGAKAQEVFRLVIIICQYALAVEDADLLLILCKCLVRLRVTSERFIFFSKPMDMDGLATTFGRNTQDSDFKKEAVFQWTYPETLDYLPEKYFNQPSKSLKLFNPNGIRMIFADDEYSIDISKWFAIVLEIMSKFINWEVYSYIWAHFCSQLANITLFFNNSEEIIKLKTIVCDQLMLNLPKSLLHPEHLTKGNLQVAFVRTLSALLGYHDFFSKYDEDHIIKALLFGLSSWEKTAIPCINILTVCCYAIPLSIKKSLPAILSKLQTRVTSAFASSHTLEFLMSLINLPTLTSSFTIDEYKRVFAIAFKYIEYANDTKERKAAEEIPEDILQTHGIDAEVEQAPTTQATKITPILSEYLSTLSYNVISSWFLKMDLSERKQVSSFLIKNLILLSNDGRLLSDQTLAYLDLIARFTYSDVPLKIMNPSRVNEALMKKLQSSGHESYMSTNRWILGCSIISIDTNMITGESLFTIRRPTGVSLFRVELDPSMIPECISMTKSTSSTGLDLKPLFNSNHMLLQIYSSLDTESKFKPLPLIEEPVTLRALSAFDRIPVIEYHKVGLIYIGPNQAEEIEILGNKVGSHDYQHLLDNLGDLIKLKGCKDIYLGGLDNENNMDGEYAVFWSDKTTQLIFHTATMMPQNENDKYFDFKKRHIGNNYVNIFFDDSGLPFNFNVIKSQFNFLNIVISSHTPSSSLIAVKGNLSNVESNSSTPQVQEGSGNSYIGSNYHKYFKIKTYRRSGVPGVFATCHFKIISEDQLPIFIRNLAISADLFASVWHSSVTGSYTSNWAYRTRQIISLREKTIQNHQDLRNEQDKNVTMNANSTANMNTTQAFLQQLQFDSSTSSNTRDYKNETGDTYEYLSHNDNELFSAFEFNSYT